MRYMLYIIICKYMDFKKYDYYCTLTDVSPDWPFSRADQSCFWLWYSWWSFVSMLTIIILSLSI